ncbi:MAG TPA: alpha-amylase family glycosyl hydrolase [Steroidobacteraceae bacterium]|jgi:alpha-glucosidase|nr:alpha-amylase family glycosyl hydrolase [Steroidobacteraceae bacterium]
MSTYLWWQSGIIYQIYPRSFLDASGDGVGDLSGIIRQLDYCAELGVDALWLSPIYPSPMADFGYDIADFTDVDPLFGTLPDFDRLHAEVKRRGMKLILDYVPNHTSSQHPWFKDSRASRDSAKRDWYLWRDPAPGGGPPNNWLSNFGGSAWEWDEPTSQYYYHAFLKEQPDLNWRNPAVVAAMHEVMRFWLERGVDGFRIDVLWLLIKDDQWRDNPPNPNFKPGMQPFHSQLPLYTSDRPEVMDVMRGLRRVADEFKDRVLVGEIYLPLDRLIAYYGPQLQGVQLPFNFLLLQNHWDADDIGMLINRYEAAIPNGGWPNWVLGNHDNPRIATRVGAAQARIAAMLLLTLRGTPTMYYGDEIGMTNVPIPPQRIQDPLEKNVPGKGLGRDPCRTPMQWDASRNAGFSQAEPWLPVAADFPRTNVAVEDAEAASILRLYRQLIALRRAHPALSVGATAAAAASEDLLSYVRHGGGQSFLVVLNLGAKPRVLSLAPETAGRVVLSSYLDRSGNEAIHDQVALRANEGLIVALACPVGAERS